VATSPDIPYAAGLLPPWGSASPSWTRADEPSVAVRHGFFLRLPLQEFGHHVRIYRPISPMTVGLVVIVLQPNSPWFGLTPQWAEGNLSCLDFSEPHGFCARLRGIC
jgi:hypothetical protein